MNRSRSTMLPKLLILAKTAARQELAYRATLVGRLCFFVVLLLIFSGLWRTIFAAGPFRAYDPAGMLWYLFVTECITLAAPRLVTDVEEDVRSGNIAYLLLRPLAYPGAVAARGAGILMVRLFCFSLIGGAFTCMFAGRLPQNLPGMLCVFGLMLLACFVLSLFETSIGLSALWLQEATPLFWVWQKLLFILGGLMFPLAIYPDWLKNIAQFTPFYALLYGPARLMIAFNWSTAWHSLLLLLFWAAVAMLIIRLLFSAAERSLTVNGG